MPTNPSIIQVRPVRSLQNHLADALGYETAAQNNQINGLKMDAYKRDQDRQNKLLSVLGGLPQGATDEDRIGALQGGGYFDEADKVQKGVVERKNAESQALERGAKAAKDNEEVLMTRRRIIGNALRSVQDNPTPERANIALDHLELSGMPKAEVDRLRQYITEYPQAIGDLAKTAYSSISDPKDLLYKEVSQDTGGAIGSGFYNPASGATTINSTTAKTQSPDNRANNARMAAEGAANRGVQMRGQNLTDARSRDSNDINKTLTTEKKQLEVDALKRGKDASISAAANQIAVIDKALKHPGRATATGLSGTLDPRNFVPGTDATDFRSVLDQIGGSAFLQAFESLKGGGAITEVEGKRATDAIARLSRAQSDEEFETSLNDLRKVMTDGYKRLSGAEYGGASSGPKPGTVENGYRFKGGNAGDPKNWEKQ